MCAVLLYLTLKLIHFLCQFCLLILQFGFLLIPFVCFYKSKTYWPTIIAIWRIRFAKVSETKLHGCPFLPCTLQQSVSAQLFLQSCLFFVKEKLDSCNLLCPHRSTMVETCMICKNRSINGDLNWFICTPNFTEVLILFELVYTLTVRPNKSTITILTSFKMLIKFEQVQDISLTAYVYSLSTK